MALTRNEAAVSEVVGSYGDPGRIFGEGRLRGGYHPHEHAAMVLGERIDLRLFPRHWVHAFALERPGEGGPRRSVQVFDAAGDAVHKVHLREGSDAAGWDALGGLATDEAPPFAPRPLPAPPKGDPSRLAALREGWARMTDTHQFFGLVREHGFDRLGAYRAVGEPLARPLAPSAAGDALAALAGSGISAMIFVGNRGCLQIATGPIGRVEWMGPWVNVLDPGFDLHTRADRVAEAYAVEKPTDRGPALSVEAFDADGALIVQIFAEREARDAWAALVAGLPHREAAV
jgi:putative hemin transport protein